MKKILYIPLMVLAVLSCSNQEKNTYMIGYYFPDVMHGITFINKAKQVFLFRLGYVNKEKEYMADFLDHRDLLENESGQKYGASAVDYSYNKNGFTTDDGNIVWLEWSKLDNGNGAIGKIYTEKPKEVIIEALQGWPELPRVYYKLSEDGIEGGSDLSPGKSEWRLKVLNKQPTYQVASMQGRHDLEKRITKGKTHLPDSLNYKGVAAGYSISKKNPLYFYAGTGEADISRDEIDQRLKGKKEEYKNTRFKLKTPFGEIWEAVSNHLNNSRVWGTQTKHIGYVVNRGWCNFYDQRLFCWDTFFHAMLASLEDPEGARESVRAILTHQTPIGIVPNNTIGNDTARNTNDRSQYPVGSMCVWKIHQYQPDKAFLEEVYPKLLIWHNWWFDIRPENGLPYRDGNRNGILEGGTEIGTWLQGAKYELLDNSPMFDDVRMNNESRTMELDMVGLSAIWAMDALYLSYIADELGKADDAEKLRNDVETMNTRINKVLWNEEAGMYCNKYWDEYSRKPKAEDFNRINPQTFVNKIIMSYTDPNGQKISKKVSKLSLTKEEVDYFFENDIPVHFTASITPAESNVYFFYTPEETGVLLEVDSSKLIDNRVFWITEFISEPVFLEKGRQHLLKMTYTGDIPFEILWTPETKHEGSLFSERLTPMLFYPLISEAPDSAKGARLMENMLDTTLFWGDNVIPTVSRNDPAFPGQGYWRGRIWPPTNYLVYLGLKNYASNEVVADYVLTSAKMAQYEWVNFGNLPENYSGITGKGMGTRDYCWGGLMQLMLLEELTGINVKEEKVRNPAVEGGFEMVNFPVN